MWVRVPSSAPKEKGTERCLFLLVPAAAGTSASLHVWQEPAVPPHTPPPFFVIPYSLRSKRTAPATGRGLEPGCAPGFFFVPNLHPRSSRSEPSRIKEGTRKSAFFWLVPPASPRQPFPNPCRRAALRNSSLFTLLYSLFTRPALPLFPSGMDSKTKIYFVFWSLGT